MVSIEMINYTFFIVKKFSVQVLVMFIVCALLGFILTHLSRILILKLNIFRSKMTSIWMYAFVFSFGISLIVTIITEIPIMIKSGEGFSNMTVIGLVGSTINWMRYVGVWIIIYFMYKIILENNKIQNEKLEIENIAKTTELELLKTQLNPHFLFNALNAIKALVLINPQESRDAIVKLSELLRFTLQYGKESLIPLKNEISEINKYLDLERLRFENRLEVKFNFEAPIEQQTIPPASILTLVENAIKHGISKQIDGGVIEIKTFIDLDGYKIQVINDGNYKPDFDNNGGIGLKHVTKRLEEIYNHKASFKISQVDKFVVAEIVIPIA